MDVDAWGMEATGILLDDGFAFGANFEGFDVEMGEEEAGFDGDGACTEADVPKGVTFGQVKGLEGEEADGHLRNHLFATVEEEKGGIGEAEGGCGGKIATHGRMRGKDEAVGVLEVLLGGSFEGESGDSFEGGVAEVFANVHLVMGEAVIEHTLGDGGGSVFLVGQNTDFGRSFDEGTVELLPRTSREGNDAHIVVGKDEAMCKGLEGVEGGVEGDFGIGKLLLNRVGKAEEEGVARSENNDGFLVRKTVETRVLFKHGIERSGDVYPFRFVWQEGCDNLMVSFAARENFAVLNEGQHFGRKKRLWVVGDAYDDKAHKLICLVFKGLFLVLVVRHRRK